MTTHQAERVSIAALKSEELLLHMNVVNVLDK